jgi:hypothetical protein
MQQRVWQTLLATLLSACAGTSTGNPVDAKGHTAARGAAACETVHTTQLALDAESPLGISAAELLALANRVPASTLAWPATDDKLRIGPESGTSALSITVTAKSDQARFVEIGLAIPSTETAGTVSLEKDVTCPSRLELDVQVHIETAGGALNETFDAELWATSRRLAVVPNVELPATRLQGSLSAELPGPEWTSVDFSMRFSELGSAGDINLIFSEPIAPDSKSGAEVETASIIRRSGGLAHWPVNCARDKGIPTTLDRRIDGMNALDAIELINDAQLQLQLPGAELTPLQAKFSADADLACALELGAQPIALRLVVHGKLRVQSGDGHIDGNWGVELTAQPSSDGALELAKVSHDRIGGVLAGLVDPEQFEASYGWHDVDLTGADRVGVVIEISRAPAGAASGELTLYGATPADCSRPLAGSKPQSDVDAGMPASGSIDCGGTMLTPLLTGQISE